MVPIQRVLVAISVATLILLTDRAAAQDTGTPSADKFAMPSPYSPYVDRSFPERPYLGDTHLHTAFSMDAGAFGARLDLRDGYRFARGESVISSTGQPVRLSRPLDS